ncbi:beta-lactamase family protein [Pseudoalteromonas luteoviolacea]|uniref:serine hydrolase domain-containing protein n=1 Tax=Pseudoalteromonas luteoviolacea TaxID=43657 RepID=UPI001F251210|nr:serine hydrolase domain-containing protein [Pseudoalteromonas luteoviolacea]MCF6440514.1 beta-lactamase family protein [Pseudoalteromonas luteoviolacea]
MKKITLLASLIAGLSLSSCTFALDQTDIQKISQQIEHRLAGGETTGLSIAVVKDNTPVMLQGFGLANTETQQPVTPDTQFRIASITKTFVTLAVLKLVNQGKLSLDDSVYKHLPDFKPKTLPNNNNVITVRDLLTHQSGIPTGWFRGDEPTTSPNKDLNSLAALLSDDYLVWNRGTISAYNNNAFGLAGLLVSRISGQSWQDYLHTEFFTPLAMNNTLSHLPNGPLPVQMAQSYSGTAQEPKFASLLTPAGGIISTGNDMARYMQAILDSWNYDSHAIVPSSLITKVRNVQNAHIQLDGDHEMGLGFFVDHFNGHIAISHDGSYQGYESMMYIVPELNFGVFVTTNNRDGDDTVFDIADMVTNMVTQSVKGPFLDNKNTQKSSFQPSQSKTLEAGFYAGRRNIFIEKTPSGEFVMFSPGQTIKQLKQVDSDSYQIIGEEGDVRIKLTQAIDGFRFTYNGKDSANVFSKLVTTKLTPELEKLLGYYQVETTNPDIGDIKVRYSPEFQALLAVSVKHGFVRALKVVDENLLQVQGYGRGIGTVFDFQEPNKLKALGYQFKKISTEIQ